MGAVYLGQTGQFELTRDALGERIASEVRGSDVNPVADRFSFDFPPGAILSGDMLEIRSLDRSLLEFVSPGGWGDNRQHTHGKWYVHVDEVGGVKLYRKFEDAVAGERAGRVELIPLRRVIPIEFTISNAIGRCMAEVTGFSFSTTRETQDVSELSEEFRRQYSTTISGSGQLTCYFDYRQRGCNGPIYEYPELPVYLHQLVLRHRLGAEFKARLFLITYGSNDRERDSLNDQVWYEINGVVTNVGISFEPGAQVRSTVDFITTGEIKLRVKTTTNYLLQEQGSFPNRIGLEEYQDGFIELEANSSTD